MYLCIFYDVYKDDSFYFTFFFHSLEKLISVIQTSFTAFDNANTPVSR